MTYERPDLPSSDKATGAGCAEPAASVRRATLEDLRRRSTCSVEEAAVLLGVGRSTAYAAARDGSLPTLKISHRLLVPTARLLAMIGAEPERGE